MRTSWIDETISILEVSFTLSDVEPNSTLENLVIIFTDAAGGRIHPATESLIVSTASTRLYRFEINNERAIWHLNFGQMACPPPPAVTLNIRAQSYLIANVMFFDDKTFEKVENQPVAGGRYSVFIDCPDCGEIGNIRLSKCGDNNDRENGIDAAEAPGGSEIQRTKSNGWWYVQNVTLPDADLICIEFSGKTKKETAFVRVHREKIAPSPFVITGRIYSTDFPANNWVYQKRNATLAFQIEHRGSSKDTVEITVDGRKANKCKLRQTRVVLDPGQIYHGVAEIEAIGDMDEIDNIDLNVASLTNSLATAASTFDFSIVDNVLDTRPPTCRVVHSTKSSCPKQSLRNCRYQNYTVIVEMSDDGNGIADIKARNGHWVIPEVAVATIPGTRIRAEGSISCCEDSQVFVIDKGGLFDTCDFFVSSQGWNTVISREILLLSFALWVTNYFCIL